MKILYLMTWQDELANGKHIVAFSFNRDLLIETVNRKNEECGENLYRLEMIPCFDKNKDVIPTFIPNED